MSDAVVESRRFRTWDESRPLEAENRIRLLIKAQFLRYQKDWSFWVVFGLAVVGAIAALQNPFTELSWGGYVDGSWVAASYFSGAAGIAMLAALLFGSPSIAEDIRFNAPLFYFSRPLRVWDYVLAKVGFVFALLGTLVGMALLTTLVGTLLTIRDSPPARDPHWSDSYYDSILRGYETHAINHLGDWLFLALILVAGVFSAVLFLSTTVVAVSSFTRRAWHAGVGLLVLLGTTGFVGLGLGFVVTDTAYAMLWGPFGWLAGATYLPTDAYFSPGTPRYLEGAPVVAVLSHVFLLSWSYLAIRITHARVTRMEGAL